MGEAIALQQQIKLSNGFDISFLPLSNDPSNTVNGMPIQEFRRRMLVTMLKQIDPNLVSDNFDWINIFVFWTLFRDLSTMDQDKQVAAAVVDSLVQLWGTRPPNPQVQTRYNTYTSRFEQRVLLAAQLQRAASTAIAARMAIAKADGKKPTKKELIDAIQDAFTPLLVQAQAINMTDAGKREIFGTTSGNLIELIADGVVDPKNIDKIGATSNVFRYNNAEFSQETRDFLGL